MTRFLYGAKNLDDDLVEKLRKKHEITFYDNWSDFRLELISCRRIHLAKKYDAVIYETNLCPEEFSPAERVRYFMKGLREYLEGLPVPVTVIVDEELTRTLQIPTEGNIKYLLRKK